MKPLDIKIKIGLVMVLMLLVGTVLLNLVMVFACQQYLIRAEKEKGDVLIDLLFVQALFESDEAGGGRYGKGGSRPKDFHKTSNMISAAWLDANGGFHRLDGGDEAAAASLERLVRTATLHRGKRIEFSGETWGVIWRQKKYLALSKPLYDPSGRVVAAGISLSLEPVYARLRTIQKFVGWYLLINTVLLSLAGMYRIHRMTVRPILRIIDRAEAFRPGDSAFLLEEGEESEISRLSMAFNRILDLNREDQEKLQYTVSRLEAAMAELKHAQQEMMRAEKLATVGRLASGVAHEIGNPIGIVLGYLALIKQPDTSDPEREDYIRRVEEEIERIRITIRQLLDYSRPSGEGRRVVSLHDVLKDVVRMVRAHPLFADVEVQTECNAVNDAVSADPDQLRQLFLNFLLNAADAIQVSGRKDRGRVRILSEDPPSFGSDGKETSGMMRLVFDDNGTGIAEDDLNRLFDPFFTTKPPGKGSGLGLWVSLLITESLGGKIEAENNPEGGARMILLLPVCKPFHENPPSSGIADEGGRG